jgi:hypothetical protein
MPGHGMRIHAVFIGRKRATFGSVNTPTWNIVSRRLILLHEEVYLARSLVLEVHSHFGGHTRTKAKV